MLSTHMVVIECHRICVCVCVCDYAIAIYLLDSLMRTRSRNSFMQSVPHFAIIGSYCYIAIEQKYINRKRHTREWAREWERARQLNITYKHIVGNSLVKQTNEAQNAWWLFLLSENVKFNENDLGRERERWISGWAPQHGKNGPYNTKTSWTNQHSTQLAEENMKYLILVLLEFQWLFAVHQPLWPFYSEILPPHSIQSWALGRTTVHEYLICS